GSLLPLSVEGPRFAGAPRASAGVGRPQAVRVGMGGSGESKAGASSRASKDAFGVGGGEEGE
ncbi:MAG: hypothetical protein WAO20_22235, partial [Acidobacteriota bacterium]